MLAPWKESCDKPRQHIKSGRHTFFQQRSIYTKLCFFQQTCMDVSESSSAVSVSLQPYDIQSMEFFRPEYWSGQPFPYPDQTLVSYIADRVLPVEPQGNPKNTGVGNLSFIQGIFLTQVLNQGFLNCRWVLYQLSYQGSPQWM